MGKYKNIIWQEDSELYLLLLVHAIIHFMKIHAFVKFICGVIINGSFFDFRTISLN